MEKQATRQPLNRIEINKFPAIFSAQQLIKRIFVLSSKLDIDYNANEGEEGFRRSFHNQKIIKNTKRPLFSSVKESKFSQISGPSLMLSLSFGNTGKTIYRDQ